MCRQTIAVAAGFNVLGEAALLQRRGKGRKSAAKGVSIFCNRVSIICKSVEKQRDTQGIQGKKYVKMDTIEA